MQIFVSRNHYKRRICTRKRCLKFIMSTGAPIVEQKFQFAQGSHALATIKNIPSHKCNLYCLQMFLKRNSPVPLNRHTIMHNISYTPRDIKIRQNTIVYHLQ